MIDEINKTLEVLHNGGVILYPTDTVWGIGCDATNPEAVQKIYDLKKRSSSKSMIVLVNGDRMIHYIFKDIPEVAWQIMDLSENPTTLILDKPKNVAPNIIAEDNTLAVRIIKEPFCYKLLERFKKPIVSTSANISGEPTPLSFDQISETIKNQVDYCVDYNRSAKNSKPSTIIKISLDNQVKVIRQ